LPVTTLPETGLNSSSTNTTWFWLILATVGLAALAIVWKAHRRPKNEPQPEAETPAMDPPQPQPGVASTAVEEEADQEK
jgi:hypothetical protein